jgi:hypothetical protein
MWRILRVVAGTLVMAAMMLAMAMPVFADHSQSWAAEGNEEGFGPSAGNNWGHCLTTSPEYESVSGQEKANGSPSYVGGKDKTSNTSTLCPNRRE